MVTSVFGILAAQDLGFAYPFSHCGVDVFGALDRRNHERLPS
jgi:hypothetical protein